MDEIPSFLYNKYCINTYKNLSGLLSVKLGHVCVLQPSCTHVTLFVAGLNGGRIYGISNNKPLIWDFLQSLYALNLSFCYGLAEIRSILDPRLACGDLF